MIEFLIFFVIGFAIIAAFLGRGPRRDCPNCMARIRKGGKVCPQCGVGLAEVDRARLESYCERERERRRLKRVSDANYQRMKAAAADARSRKRRSEAVK